LTASLLGLLFYRFKLELKKFSSIGLGYCCCMITELLFKNALARSTGALGDL
jgi:hypothetical protein